ncbi:MAG: OmpA family protein, partial [Bacteroidia bacterium]
MIEPKNILLLLILIISTLQIHAQEPIQRVEYSVHFESNQYHLTKNEGELLHSFVDSLQQYDVKRIYLTGHTDSDADSLYNVELSKNRTTEIKKLLSIRGIDSNVLRMTYHGEAKPVAA